MKGGHSRKGFSPKREGGREGIEQRGNSEKEKEQLKREEKATPSDVANFFRTQKLSFIGRFLGLKKTGGSAKLW